MSATYSVFIAVSLDGFIARTNGDLDWLTAAPRAMEKEDYGYGAFIDSVDALVMGRLTYERVLTFKRWPYGGKRVFVLSSGTPKIPQAQSRNVEVISGGPIDCAMRLSKAGARHVYVDGGRTIQGFLRAGLIQDLTITRIPVLIGTGRPLFGPLDRDVRLEHVETTSYPNGYVQTRYRVLKNP
jgi:dihydrofolate reductase